jgi:hypothetical protein
MGDKGKERVGMTGSVAYQKQVPIVKEADVIVVGGGPAGMTAAIASARNGAKTLLVEQYGFLGGNATAALIGPFMTSYSLDGTRQLIRGIFEELVLRMQDVGGAMHPSKIPGGGPQSGFISFGHIHVTPFDPHAVKMVAEKMCLEAGVDLLYHSFVFDSVVEGGVITGVLMANKSGLQAAQGKVIVDCSGDGDVAARAGVPFHKGRPSDGLMQPMSMFFRIANVNDEKVAEYVAAHPNDYRPYYTLIQEARARGEFPLPRLAIGIYKNLEDGEWRVNTSRILGLDGTDVLDLTKGEIDGRKQVEFLLKFFREKVPGLENCELMDIATTVGVRESRRIDGEYVLTGKDLMEGRQFEDVVALAGYPFDIHAPDGPGGGATGAESVANVYEIPYRSLLPLKVGRLLVGGRCISSDFEAHSAIRVMPTCFAIGQAAGTAAALATKSTVPPRDLRVTELQRTLIRDGVVLGERIEKQLRG